MRARGVSTQLLDGLEPISSLRFGNTDLWNYVSLEREKGITFIQNE